MSVHPVIPIRHPLRTNDRHRRAVCPYEALPERLRDDVNHDRVPLSVLRRRLLLVVVDSVPAQFVHLLPPLLILFVAGDEDVLDLDAL